MYYSAALCTPVWQHAFHGSGEEGFEWIIFTSPSFGAVWINKDTDNNEVLVCPIPYDRSVQEPFEVRVAVRDNHGTKSVVAQVVLSDNGQPYVGASASSGTTSKGFKTLFLTVDPHPDDRWVTLYVTVPDANAQGESASWVTGYRVCRDCD
jgi:hypothetical protein